jgi:hypothetical protein
LAFYYSFDVSPVLSYIALFSSFPRVSYASLISENFLTASVELFKSG